MMDGTVRKLLTMLSAAAIVIVSAAAAQDLEITRSSIDGGGVMFSSGGKFELSGTIGQPDAGVLSGGGLTLSGGLWLEQVAHDCNADGGVNLLDHAEFEACLTGPDASVREGCACFDVNHSATIDLLDFAVGQTTFTGS